MFDDVRFEDGYNSSYFRIDDIELPTNSGREYENGNLAHRPRAKGGYFPVAPVDSAMDIRGEMISTMLEMGLPCDKHHHEVAAADRKSTRLNSSHANISYAVFCLKKKNRQIQSVPGGLYGLRKLA